MKRPVSFAVGRRRRSALAQTENGITRAFKPGEGQLSGSKLGIVATWSDDEVGGHAVIAGAH